MPSHALPVPANGPSTHQQSSSDLTELAKQEQGCLSPPVTLLTGTDKCKEAQTLKNPSSSYPGSLLQDCPGPWAVAEKTSQELHFPPSSVDASSSCPVLYGVRVFESPFRHSYGSISTSSSQLKPSSTAHSMRKEQERVFQGCRCGLSQRRRRGKKRPIPANTQPGFCHNPTYCVILETKAQGSYLLCSLSTKNPHSRAATACSAHCLAGRVPALALTYCSLYH